MVYITDQSGHHFALWTMGRSDRFNIGLTRNVFISLGCKYPSTGYTVL